MGNYQWVPYDENRALYYSTFHMFETCGQHFLWANGWKGIDVGGGEGRPKPKPKEDSRHHAIMGIVIQGVLEDFYKQRIWTTRKGDALLATLDVMVQSRMSKALLDPRNTYEEKIMSRGQMIRVCLDGVFGYMNTMARHKLLGTSVDTERDMKVYLGNSKIPLGGRPDIVVHRPDLGVSLLDGKNTLKKDSVDPDQLRWYALVYFLVYGKMPDRLGFVFYRFPYDPAKGEEGVQWVSVTTDDLKSLAARANQAHKAMVAQHFEPAPSPSNCKFCDYETVCEARQLTKRKVKPKGSSEVEDRIATSDDGVVIL